MSDSPPWRSILGVPVKHRPCLHKPGGLSVQEHYVWPDADAFGVMQDRRIHLDVKALRQLLELAESTPMLRVVIHGAQLEVERILTDSGHMFESWTFAGHPAAEPAPGDVGELASKVQEVRNRATRGGG